MTDDVSRAQAFWVTRQGEVGQAVLARHALIALAEVVVGSGCDECTIQRLTAQRHADGWSATVDGAVWTVRPHKGATDERASGLEAAPDLRAAAERALSAAREAVPSESGAVLFVDGSYLRFEAVDGPEAPHLKGVRLPLTTGVAGYAVQTHQTQYEDRPAVSARHYRAIDDITGYESRGILAVPVVAGGVVLGVIELINPPEDRSFSLEDGERVERIANVLASWMTAHRGR